MIFDSDDNDGVQDWNDESEEVTPSPSQPSTPSLPTRRAAKTPFGATNPEGDENPAVPKTGAGSLPSRKPASPFGQNPSGNRASRPQPPLSAVKRPISPAPENPAPTPPPTPFSRPIPQRPVEKAEPVEPVPSTPEPESAPQPERLSEAELLLRSIREDAELRSAKAREAEQAAKVTQPAPNAVAPVLQAATEPAVSSSDPEPAPGEDTQKTKKGFFSSKPKKDAPAAKKEKTPNKKGQEPKEDKYAGERRKVLYIRLVAGGVAAIIGIAGLQAIFMPNTGPSKAQVVAAAQEAVNYTGFPTVSGEQFSIDFARAYFNYNSQDQNRLTNLSKFASPDLLKQIDVQPLSSQEYDAQKKVGSPDYSQAAFSQSVTYGPYVVATNNLTATSAVFTVKVGLNSGSVLYLDVPVKYDPQAYSLTLAGPPSFSKPIQNQGAGATKDQWTATFPSGTDDTIAASFQPDLQRYLTAWAASDSTTISRFVLDQASDNAKRGLQGAVQFDQIISLSVEAADPSNPSTATERRVEVNVMWLDPKTNTRYPQEYRMLIGLNSDKKWAVYDIENFYLLNKNS